MKILKQSNKVTSDTTCIMTEEKCPFCGSTTRRTMYNKWHVKEIYCGECFECLNQEQLTEQTRLAQMAAKEGKLTEFWMGQYTPSEESEKE